MAERVRPGQEAATLGAMDRMASDDVMVVAAMTAGDPAGLDSAYRQYADRLYAYSRSIVGDHDTASDVVQETFLVAQERVRQLRDASRLGSWLYTIARNECLQRIRQRRRAVTLADSHEAVLDTDPGRSIHAEQVREIVHAAAAGLNEGEREIFELTVRHGLSAAEVAGVLGVSVNHAHARISRARTQFEGALGALVLARDAGDQCPTLAGLLEGWDGRLTVLLRKRVERHVRDCAVCADRRRDRMNPSALLAAYGALPFLAVTQEWTPPSSLGRPSRAGSSTARRNTVLTAGVVALIVGVFVGVQMARSNVDSLATALPSPLPSPPPTVAISADPPENLAPPGGRESTTPQATAGSASTTITIVTAFVVPFTAQASARTTCSTGASFALVVGVETRGAALANARLYWRIAATASAAMTVSGSTARRTVHLSAPKVTWWIVATAADGRSVTTPQVTTSNPCP